MKRFALACAVVTLLFAGGRHLTGQGGGNPFVDHSDTGETVHVLPTPASIRSPRDTQPTDAPASDKYAVYGASYGSGNLTDHGGPEMAVVDFFAVYYNATVAGSTGSQGNSTLRQQVTKFINAFSDGQSYNSADQNANFSIVQQYGTAASNALLVLAGDYVDPAPPAGNTLSDSKVQSYLAGLFNAGKIAANDYTIYGIYFPSGMRITLQGGASCSSFCGYHGHFSYQGNQIKYAVFPYTDCRACSMPGKQVADILTIVSSHEIREATTDRLLNAWYDSSGYEADDKCAWHNLYQTYTGGFWVQPEYSNGIASGFPGPGCVVPLTNGVPK